jgi:membrane fusion protein, multidrug efflux system
MGLVCQVIAVMGLTACLVAPAAASESASAVPVVSAPVTQGDVPIVVSGVGTVQALNTAVIRSQVTGLLQSVNFREGQEVRRGDLLAQIDPRPAEAHLAATQAQLARDQAQLANLQVNLGRNLPLLSKGFATDQQVTDQKSQIAQLASAVQSDQAMIDDARATLSYTSLAAPFDGVTGVRTMDAGNIIHPTDAAGVVTVTQVQPITVMFVLPAADIPRVQDALAAGAVTAVAYDQAGTRLLDTGRLLLINNQADPTSGTVQLKAQFPNANRRLWPGTFINVEVTVRTVKGGLTIPTDAVQRGANGEFVFVIGSDHKVAAVPVEVMQRDRGVALIGRGLNPGETVVAQGQYRLVDGTEVVSAAPDQVANISTGSSGMLP